MITDAHVARIVLLLGNSGPLSRWEITQRVVTHMRNDERRALLEKMESDGLIQSYTEKKIRSGRGPAPKIFELSKRGKSWFKKIKNLDVIRTE